MKVEKLKKNSVKIVFEVTPEEFEHGLDHAFAHAQKDVTVKGFRKGKVPRNIYEKNFGVESLYEDALNHIFQHKYQEAADSNDLVGQPKVVDLDITKIERGKPFTFAFESAVKPEVKLGEYKGLEVKKENFKVTEKEINADLDNLLLSDNSLEPKDEKLPLTNGDVAIFDFEGFDNGVAFEGGKAENYELEIGSNQFIPGFEEQMIGLKVGDKKDLNVKFPADYQAKELAGKDVIFKVALHEIKIKNKAVLSDEWVVSLNREGINTVEELKADIRNNLVKDKEVRENNRVTDELVEKASKNATVDIPQEMIDAEKEQMVKNVENQAKQYGLELDMFLTLSGSNKDDFEKQISLSAAKRVLETLVLEAIAKNENFKFKAAEINAKYTEIGKEYNMEVDEIKKYIPEDVITKELGFNKAVELIKSTAKKI